MSNKLSFSQVNKYGMCPKSFQHHYIDKLRPTTFSAALAFGSALDVALNVLLMEPDKSAEESFIKEFTNQKVNDVDSFLPADINLMYAATDIDLELVLPEDMVKIAHIDYASLAKKKKDVGIDNMTTDERKDYNLCNWMSLKAKGLLMLKVYRKKVLPKILKVHAVQKYVEVSNTVGDKVIGYVDLIADIEGHGTVVLDHKTSAREYDDAAVLTSPQLTLYMHILEEEYKTRKAGFIVLRKTVVKNRKKTCSKCGHDGSGGRAKTCDNEIAGKRCGGEWREQIDPDITIQFIVDEVPPRTEEIVMQNFDDINTAIKAGVFTRNFNSCENTYGGRCVYFDKCFKDSERGLIKKE